MAHTDPSSPQLILGQDPGDYQLIVNSVRDYAIILLDASGVVVSWNPGAERFKGYKAHEIIGQHFSRFYPEEAVLRGFPQEELRMATKNGRFEDEGWRVRQDGSQFWANVIITALHGQTGNLRGFVKLTRDLTERKRAEQDLLQARDDLEARVAQRTQALSQLNRELQQAKEEAERANLAKSEFISRMSHELRTPLNAILGFGQILEMSNLSDDDSQSVGQILRGGRHLLTLVNEVLDIARVEAGQMSLSLEPVHTGEICHECLALVRALAKEKGVTLHNLHPGHSIHVMADQQRLKQILLNLLSNAIKYNRPGGSVTLRCDQMEPNRIQLSVSDDGDGIPADKHSRLFAPFDRLGAEQNGIEGTGIGLAISRRLAEAMNGHLDFHSEIGQGSTFWVELEVTESALEPLEGLEDSHDHLALRDQAVHPAAQVLYIEDNLSNLKLIERLLAFRPVELLSAQQGQLGLDLARQYQPALILLDLNLPDINGQKVLAKLQEDPLTQNIPVVMLSADATPNQIQRLLGAGAKAYLTKPIEVREFYQTVDQILITSLESA